MKNNIYKDEESTANANNKEAIVNEVSKSTKNAMIFLFVFTILSVYIALIVVNIVALLKNSYGSLIFKSAWIFWMFLPVPILSIVLGYKYKKRGLKCKKNIYAGFIVGFLLLMYGSFCILPNGEIDYTNINNYKEYLGVKIPEDGYLETLITSNFDNDKSDYVRIRAYYGNQDITELDNSIQNSDNWLSFLDIKSNLKPLLPSNYHLASGIYFSIYNKTLNEYNNPIEMEGEYEIYTMIYNKNQKTLDIHKFKYLYR